MKSEEIDNYIRQHIENKTYREIGTDLGMHSEAIRKRAGRMGIKRNDILKNQFENSLLKSGFEETNWSHGWLKDDGVSVFIRNKEGIMSYNDIKDEIISEMKAYAPKYPTIKRKKIPEGNMLVIDPADVHIGKLAIKEETGGDYNMKIAVQRALEGVRGIMERAKVYPLEKIVLVIGNDIIHVDSVKSTTTKGTTVDADGLWWQMFKEAKSLYVKIIEELVSVADVHVIYNPSNHDVQAGFMLADSLSSWFHNAKNITFDVSIKHRKYLQYGKNLICTSHGDAAKVHDMPLLMASEAKQMWADTNYRYIYLHHIHHKKQIKWQSGKDYQGATVEYLRSPSASDGWSYRNGFTQAPKAIEGFVHHKTEGQICRITKYF